MDQLFDTLARILATPMSRRKAVGLASSALAAAVVAALGVQPVSAEGSQSDDRRCTRQQRRSGFKTCRPNGRDGDDDDRDDDDDDDDRDDERRKGGDAICCPPGTCCANGRGSTACCQRGQCVCSNGKCAASSGGRCPSGCSRCNG